MTVEITYPSLDGAECPYPQYEHLLRAAPVYQVPGSTDFLVTSHALVSQAAKDWRTFSSAGSRSEHNPFNETGSGKTTHSLIETDPPAHRAVRDLCAQAFKPAMLTARIPRIEAVCDELIDAFLPSGEADLVCDYAEHVPLRVMAEFLGFDDADLNWLSGWSRVDNGGLSFLPPDVQETQRRNAQRATAALSEVLLDRHANPRDDGLSLLIRTYVEKSDFDLDFLRDNVVTLIRGGVITTAHLIGMTMHLLLEHPSLLADAAADEDVLRRLVEESLRVESPVQWTPRRVRADTELGGVPIPAGSRVLLMWGAANRDGSVFASPEEFRADRTNLAAQAAFGLGPHFCLGAPLARLEATMAIGALLRRLSHLELLPQPFDHAASAQFRGLNHLYVRFEPA
jgi:cytochrome P450